MKTGMHVFRLLLYVTCAVARVSSSSINSHTITGTLVVLNINLFVGSGLLNNTSRVDSLFTR